MVPFIPAMRRHVTRRLWLGWMLALAIARPDSAAELKPADETDTPRVPADWKVPAGYRIEVLHRVDAATEGSWVSLAAGPPDGTGEVFFAGDQYGAIYQVHVPHQAGSPSIRRLPVDVGHAQGLLWHGGRLLVMVNQQGRSGLYALDDADHDGLPEHSRLILAIDGEGEHGPHAVVQAPDGRHVLVVCGNHTRPPPKLQQSRLAPASSVDGLLDPREWDPRGHARNILAPGGFILEVDPASGEACMLAAGLRNSYDMAVAPTGEMYTFDSDMEWDMGMPWYRPTRLIQVVSGGDYGWRSGSGNWPVWRQEMLPPVADVGPGSPTGMLTGSGAAFPAADQQALYLLDWTFGTVFRVRLQESGAWHTAVLDPFLTGRGLPLTDAVIGSDGAMYLITGGRKTNSQLLRIRYVGSESTGSVAWPVSNAAAHRRLALEQMHGTRVDAAGIETLLAALADPDRSIRFAARVGLERQERERWVPRLASLGDAASRSLGWLAALRATREVESPWVEAALEDLGLIAATELSPEGLLVWLRAHQWALMDRPGVAVRWRDRLLARLDALYPHADPAANAELVILLVHLKTPRVIERTLDLMDAAPAEAPRGLADHITRNPQYGDTIAAMIAHPPPTEALRFAFALRQLDTGWTWPTHERYFRWMQQARATRGGMSFSGFMDIMQAQALATCDPTTRLQLQSLLMPPVTWRGVPMQAALGPGRPWTVTEAESALSGQLSEADFDRGAGLFATYCAACHRLGGSGGAVGPDLTSAAQKFTLHDLLEAVMDPDKSVSDQYQVHEWVFKDGTRRLARQLGTAPDGQLEYLENPMSPAIVGRVRPDQVASVTPSPHSPMPPQLTHGMNAEELRDLIAHVASAGGIRRDFGDWQGKKPKVMVTLPPSQALSPAAWRILLGAVAVLAALSTVIFVMAGRESRR